MDLHHQETIKRLAEELGRDNLVVVIGDPDPESAEITTETLVLGDPTFAGALSEVQLGLAVYHVLEPDVREAIPADTWEEQIGVMADVLDGEAIGATVRAMREKRPA